MPSPTTARGLLGRANLPDTNQRATNPPVLLPPSLFLRDISVAGAGGRGMQGRASGHKAQGKTGGEAPEREEGTGTDQGGHAARQRKIQLQRT